MAPAAGASPPGGSLPNSRMAGAPISADRQDAAAHNNLPEGVRA